MPLVLRPHGRVPKSYDEIIVNEYAKAAAGVPKHVSDSIIAATKDDPRHFATEMQRYLTARDAIVRKAIAQRFGISVDSLARILDNVHPDAN